MKTAVCFFGEIRGNPEHWKKIYDNIVLPNNADVFMSHTIYDTNFIETHTQEQQELLINYYKNKGLNYSVSDNLMEIFKPKIIKCSPKYEYPLEPYNLFVDNVNHVHSLTVNHNFNYDCTKLGYYAIMNQNDTRSSVIQLKQEYEIKMNILYDNIILTRLDINPIAEIKLLDRLNNISGKIFNNFMYEQVILGPSDKMNIFIKLLKQMPELYIKNCNMEHHFMQNEYHICKFLEHNNMNIDFIDIPLSYNSSIYPNGLMRFDFSFI